MQEDYKQLKEEHGQLDIELATQTQQNENQAGHIRDEQERNAHLEQELAETKADFSS